MAAPKLNAVQQAKVIDEISIRYLRGERQADIAALLDLSQQQISYYLRKLQAAWRERAAVQIDAAQAEELAKINELERAYYQEWELSRQPGTRTIRSRQTKTSAVSGRKAAALQKTLAPADPEPGASAPPATGAASGVQVTETVRRSMRTTITRLGKPAYLAGVQWCIQTRCAILGIKQLPPSEDPPRADAPTPIDADAVAAAEAVLLRAYAEKRAALVPQLPPDGATSDTGGHPA